MKTGLGNLIVAIYYHPEGYPPTLNALAGLSDLYNRIDVVHRPQLVSNWEYPGNVRLHAPGKQMSARGQEQAPTLMKLVFFIRFMVRFFTLAIRRRPSMILVYDPISLFAYFLVRPFLFSKHRVWYHSHDVVELRNLNKYSIGWFGIKWEHKKFHLLDIFSLPTVDRLPYYNMKRFRGQLFCIPNFPSIAFYGKHFNPDKTLGEIRFLFQGRIAPGHGIEMIMELLAEETSLNVKLVLKGFCDPDYKEKLLGLVSSSNIGPKVEFTGLRPYREIPSGAAECHIGVAIFESKDIMNSTLDTASNKVYEYAAAGLPIIYLANSSVAKALAGYDWAHCVENTPASVRNALQDIVKDYRSYATSAYRSFLEKLNYESQFKPVKEFLKDTTPSCAS